MQTSGTLAQAYSTNLLTTTRKAVSVLENEHLAPDAWVLCTPTTGRPST